MTNDNDNQASSDPVSIEDAALFDPWQLSFTLALCHREGGGFDVVPVMFSDGQEIGYGEPIASIETDNESEAEDGQIAFIHTLDMASIFAADYFTRALVNTVLPLFRESWIRAFADLKLGDYQSVMPLSAAREIAQLRAGGKPPTYQQIADFLNEYVEGEPYSVEMIKKRFQRAGLAKSRKNGKKGQNEAH